MGWWVYIHGTWIEGVTKLLSIIGVIAKHLPGLWCVFLTFQLFMLIVSWDFCFLFVSQRKANLGVGSGNQLLSSWCWQNDLDKWLASQFSWVLESTVGHLITNLKTPQINAWLFHDHFNFSECSYKALMGRCPLQTHTDTHTHFWLLVL